MNTPQSRPSCFSALFIIVIWGLPGTSAGAERDPDALPAGAVGRLSWSPLRIGYGSAFCFAADGRTIVVVSPQGNLRRLDAQTGRLLERRQLTDRSDVDLQRDCSVQLSEDGQTLAVYESSYGGPRVTVYEVASGKRIFRRESGKKLLRSGKLSPNGKHLAVVEWPLSGSERTLRLIDLKTGRLREMAVYGRSDLGIYFSADGKRLLVSEPAPQTNELTHLESSKILYFNPTSGRKIWERGAWGTHFSISRDGKIVVASGYRDRTAKESGFYVFQTNDDSAEPTESFLPCFHDKGGIGGPLAFTTFLLAPDDRTIVSQQFGQAYLWDLHTRKEIRRFQFSQDVKMNTSPLPMAISPDSRTLLTNVEHLQRWDLASGKPAFTPPDNNWPKYLLQLAFAPDGKVLFAASDKGLSRWNLATGIQTNLIQDKYGFHDPIFRTPDGVRAIHRNSGAKLTVFDPVADKTLHTIRLHTADEIRALSTNHASLTANGKVLLAICDGKRFRHAAAWEVATGRKLSDFPVTTGSTIAQRPFSPCGRWVMLSDKLYHVGSGTELFEPCGSLGEWMNFGDFNVWFSEDGRLLATTIGTYEEKWPRAHTLAVWERASGKILARFSKPGFVAQAAFLSDGHTFVMLDAQGLRLEDLLSGKQVARFPAADVICNRTDLRLEQRGLAFSPNGGTLATAHHDGSIMMWNVPTTRNTKPVELADGETEILWTHLGSSSPLTARTAVDRLARNPDAASALLAKHFRPPAADPKIAVLIDDLDSDVFVTREQAARKLRDYGAKAETALRGRLTKSPSLEMRRRIESILTEMAPPPLHLPLSGEHLRGVRAIEVLERTGNKAARSLLQSWAEQTRDVQLAIEARMALERIGNAKPSTAP